VLLDVAVLPALMSFIGTTACAFLFREESAEHEARNKKEKGAAEKRLSLAQPREWHTALEMQLWRRLPRRS
jgi:hypothetical protein